MTTGTRRKRRSSQHNKELSAQNRLKKRRMKIAAVCAGFFAVLSGVMVTTTGVATAGGGDCSVFDTSCIVPEISALEGSAALAVIAAMLLLAWERRARA